MTPTKVLVLEDSPTQAMALRHVLEDEGFSVATAADGKRGLELHRAGDFDIVISDVIMPGMTGYDFCRAAKSDKRLREVPVVLLTSLSKPADIVEGLQCGADNFITKPYQPDALVARVRAIVARRRQRSGGKRITSIEIDFLGHRLRLSPENEQILDLLLGSVDQITRANRELELQREELRKHANELARLNQDLARARDLAESESRFKSRFLASMSHELRTPLNSILGFSELLAKELAGPLGERQKEYIDNVVASGRHLLDLVNDILDLSKIAAGKMQLHREPTPLVHLLDMVLATISPLAHKQSLSVTADVPDDLPPLDVDPVRFKEVLLNLLSNAVKFTRPGGRVAVSAGLRDGGRRIEVAVADTGIGIKPDDVARLFREFEQLASDDTVKVQGTGLGLALCKKLVELHGGTIAVKSSPGHGSTFTVCLPTG